MIVDLDYRLVQFFFYALEKTKKNRYVLARGWRFVKAQSNLTKSESFPFVKTTRTGQKPLKIGQLWFLYRVWVCEDPK